jgi:hypothetical protein
VVDLVRVPHEGRGVAQVVVGERPQI